jgi:hypothetical protein
MLDAVKKLAPICGRPVTNMWCTHNPNDRKPDGDQREHQSRV